MTSTFSNDHTQLKELLVFGFDIQDAFVRSLGDDGKFTGADAANFLPVLPSAIKAFDGLGNPWERYKLLTPEEKQDLIGYAQQRFDLPNDELENLIEQTFLEIYGDYRLAMKWRAYIRAKNADQADNQE